MNLGTEPKKMAMLGGLALVAAYSIYTNVLAPDVPAGAQRQAAATRNAASKPTVEGLPQPPTPAQKQTDARLAQRKQAFGGRQAVGEFRASMKCQRGEDCPDVMKVDPTLRLDLLAKLQKVTFEGGQRALFDFGAAPPPKVEPPPIKDIAKKAAEAAKLAAAAAAANSEVKPATPEKPKAPPIPLKFYGFTSLRSGGLKRAFFLEGEEIHVVAEGEVIKRRYKIVRIQVNSAIVEDTDFKTQQTLPLEEPPVTG